MEKAERDKKSNGHKLFKSIGKTAVNWWDGKKSKRVGVEISVKKTISQ